MELVGGEKRIQALFSELKLQDQSIAPSFDRLWQSAQTTKPNRIASMQPIVVLGSLMIIGAAWTIGVLSTDALMLPASQDDVAMSVPISVATGTEVAKKHRPKTHSTIRRKKRRPAELDETAIDQAVALASWQSPTYGLMESAVPSAFKTLPDLGQSAQELESYLSNEVKELDK